MRKHAGFVLVLFFVSLSCLYLHGALGTMTIAVPSYFYACTGTAGNCLWQRMNNNSNAIKMSIVNPNSGPGSSIDNNYVVAVNRSQKAGIAVIGYVHTSYGGRNITKVKSEIDKYYNWYKVDGIFFDEVSSSCSDATSYYKTLYTFVKAKTIRQKLVVLNPGTNVPECFVNSSNVIVTFESPYSDYKTYTSATWYTKYPTWRFWHIVYSVNATTLPAVITKAKSHHAGRVYITNDSGANPYDTLPSYLTSEVNLVLAS